VPRGIPHSVFLGRIVGPGEPQFLAADRDKALWWTVHERQRHGPCGTRPDEWDPEQGGDLHAYEAVPVHCRGCEVAAQGDDWLERNRKNMRRGTSIQLRPTPPPEEELPP
jgi:hypothetical protein